MDGEAHILKGHYVKDSEERPDSQVMANTCCLNTMLKASHSSGLVYFSLEFYRSSVYVT